MPIQTDYDGPERFDDDLEVVLRLQAILLQAAEGQRGAELDREYRGLRKALLADPSYEMVIPKFVRRYRVNVSGGRATVGFVPKVGHYRAISEYKGSKISSPSSTSYAKLNVNGPLTE